MAVQKSLGLTQSLKSQLKKIGIENRLGATVDTYLATAQKEAEESDRKAVMLAVKKVGVLSAMFGTVADRLQAEIDELTWSSDLKIATWNAMEGPGGDRTNLDNDLQGIQQEVETKKAQIAELATARTQLDEFAAQWQSRVPDATVSSIPQFQKVAADLRQSAVLQAEKAGKVHDLEDAAQHAQIAAAHTLAANAIDPVGGPARPMRVKMTRAENPETPDNALWFKIRRSSLDVGWDKYSEFLERVLCMPQDPEDADVKRVRKSRIRLPFPDCDPYRFLKAATEVFLSVNCSTWHKGNVQVWDSPLSNAAEASDDLAYGERRLGYLYSAEEIEQAWVSYNAAPDLGSAESGQVRVLPYLALIRQKLGDVALVDGLDTEGAWKALAVCSGILRRKLQCPTLLELIWSYWHEEGMLVQTMNAITRRFQNIRTPGDRDPLAMIEIDPLRPLNNFLWGYIQDEQHRLTVVRRAYEYDHHYGLSLVGKAVPGVRGADSRKRFLEAFHQLLHLCTIFYKEDDDTTVIADGFAVLNALRDVHIILSQGAHNQYGDLPWTARQEMLMQQWLLARPEMREFLPTRVMVAYPEPWMDRVDAMKALMSWTDTSILHFREMGVYGERILLGARFNNWTEVIEPERAANWARFWRPEIQSYIHAYRAATGVDLTERADASMPSTLLRNRLGTQRVALR